MIDSGLDWSKRVMKMHPNAIFLTHAHSDHAGALKNGAPCQIFATSETWKRLQPFAIQSRYLVLPRHAIEICGLTFEVFSVEHSVVAPWLDIASFRWAARSITYRVHIIATQMKCSKPTLVSLAIRRFGSLL